MTTLRKTLGLFLFSWILLASAHQSDAEKRLVFVSSFSAEGTIVAYSLDSDSGAFAKVAENDGVAQPFFLALSPNHHFLYSIHAPDGFGGEAHEQVASYRLKGDSGQLQLLNRQSTSGSASCYLDVDRSGKTLVVANYTTGNCASYRIQADGSLAPSVSLLQHMGSSVNEARQKEPHAHCIVVGPSNRYVYAADLGIDRIVAYRLGKDSTLTFRNPADYGIVAPGSGPRHLTFHPNGRQMYVINELLNTVSVFTYSKRQGILEETQVIRTLPDGFDGTSYTADIKITPDGRFAYGTNRGHDSLACFRILKDGQLETIEIIPSLGKGPQNLAITQDGEFLICANMPGNNLALFRIDAASGRLTAVGEPITITSPSCIMIR